eukprot:2499773-Rhodomonas_salina.1
MCIRDSPSCDEPPPLSESCAWARGCDRVHAFRLPLRVGCDRVHAFRLPLRVAVCVSSKPAQCVPRIARTE